MSSGHDLIGSSSSPAGGSPVRVIAREPGRRLAAWPGNGPGRSPASNFTVTLVTGIKLTCAQAVRRLVKDKRRWEVRSAGQGSKGERWYAWAWIATASPRHHLLVRRHLKTGELAFCYCYVPEGQLLTKTRLIRAAGLRWPVEEDFEFSKDCFGLDQCQARLYTAIARHMVLVMAALAICAVTADLLKDRTGTQAPPPVIPDQSPPEDPGCSR